MRPLGPLERMLAGDGPLTEDCLTLSVWAPLADAGAAPHPVIVYLHGGGFTYGGADAVPLKELARSGAVAIAVNYRLGAFGFTGFDAESANLGLRDQICALEWVQRNATALGGDPASVTVMGHSAGGMSVGALLAIPAARKLFRRAIIQSGSAEAVLSLDEATMLAERLLEHLGAGDREEALHAPASRLVEASVQLQLEAPDLLSSNRVVGMPFQPVVDGRMLTTSPLEAVASGQAGRLDLLVGWCTEEMRYFHRMASPTAEDVAVAARDTALWFALPTERLADAAARHSEAVFRYRCSWSPPGSHIGAVHGTDLALVHDVAGNYPDLLGATPPPRLGRGLREAIVRFAATGDPAGGAVGEWKRHREIDRSVLDVNDHFAQILDPLAAERGRWLKELTTVNPVSNDPVSTGETAVRA